MLGNDYVNFSIQNKPYILNINSYECYYANVKTSCLPQDNHKMIETKNIKYKMTIYKNKNYELEKEKVSYDLTNGKINNEDYNRYIDFQQEYYDIVYEGVFKEDVTTFIEKEGIYGFSISTKIKSVTDKISFILVNDGKQIYLITRENMESKLW